MLFAFRPGGSYGTSAGIRCSRIGDEFGECAPVGRDTKRVDGLAKATGTAKYGIDSRVPGLLYAVIARCPVFDGKVASFDASKAKQVPGVREVVKIETTGRGASTTGGMRPL